MTFIKPKSFDIHIIRHETNKQTNKQKRKKQKTKQTTNNNNNNKTLDIVHRINDCVFILASEFRQNNARARQLHEPER